MVMILDERWQMWYDEVMNYIETNHRNPSQHRIEEHDMLNWMKAKRKVFNAGKRKDSRLSIFKVLLGLVEKNKH